MGWVAAARGGNGGEGRAVGRSGWRRRGGERKEEKVQGEGGKKKEKGERGRRRKEKGLRDARAAMLSYVASLLTLTAIGSFPSFVEDLKRKIERALRNWSICDREHVVLHPFLDHQLSHPRRDRLLPCWPTEQVHSLLLLRPAPVCRRDAGREPDDGCCKHSPRLSHRNHHRSWSPRSHDAHWRLLQAPG
ncbi:hypothetical protein Drorol1_Dr00021919 [Drosera rotundifolia]